MSVTQSPPSASITATSRITRPGSWAERRSRVQTIASDSASVNPVRVGQLNQQRRAGVRDQALAVRRDFYRLHASRQVHQLGVLLGARIETSAIPILTTQEDVTRASGHAPIGGSRLTVALERPGVTIVMGL